MKKLFFVCLFLQACQPKDIYERFQDPHTHFYGVKKNGHTLIHAKYHLIPCEDRVFSTKPMDWIYEADTSTPHLLSVLKCHEWWRINEQGQELFRVYHFDNGPDYYCYDLSRFVADDHKIGFHDREGYIVIKPHYNWASPFEKVNKRVCSIVCKNCFIHVKDASIYPGSSSLKHSGHHTVTGGQWGAIDRSGKEIIPLRYKTFDSVRAALNSS